MIRDEVLAVVVSYNGGPRIRETVAALRPQVGHLVIVDNGSDPVSLDVLAELERSRDITVTRLGRNTGIGHALNVGVQRARELNCRWLLTMDQDSLVDGGMLHAYQEAIAHDPALVCLAPRRSDGSGTRGPGGTVSYAITSGNLVRVSLFDEIGLYDEGLFIDGVDFDFSLRVRRAGHTIVLVPAAVMLHRLGEAVKLPAAVRRVYARHSALRRYYMYRNYLYLAERYLYRFPRFILKLGLLQLLLLPLIGLYDAHPLRSYGAILRGVGDYLARRSGPYAGRV